MGLGFLGSLKMLGKSLFSSKAEKVAWTIQYSDQSGQHPDWSRDKILEVLATEEATRLREEFVRNHTPAEIEAFANEMQEILENKDDLGDTKRAIQDLNKAIEIDPNSNETYFDRGFAKGKLGDYKGAIQDFSKAIEIDPNYVSVYFNRGFAKGELGDYRGAIQDYSKAIELDPNYAIAYHNRGFAKIKLGQKDSGCQDLSKAGEMGDMDAYDLIKEHCQ